MRAIEPKKREGCGQSVRTVDLDMGLVLETNAVRYGCGGLGEGRETAQMEVNRWRWRNRG
jgi:hypothetical protein